MTVFVAECSDASKGFFVPFMGELGGAGIAVNIYSVKGKRQSGSAFKIPGV